MNLTKSITVQPAPGWQAKMVHAAITHTAHQISGLPVASTPVHVGGGY